MTDSAHRRNVVETYWLNFAEATRDAPADRPRSEDYFWEWEVVNDAMYEGGDDALGLLCDLADAAPGKEALAYLGAGPLEDLLRLHAARMVDAVDEAARRSVRFQLALRAAWFDQHVDPEIAARLRRFGGVW